MDALSSHALAQLQRQLPDWQQLSAQALGPDSWRVSGILAGQARCLTLIQRGDGSWRLLEAGQVQRLDPRAAVHTQSEAGPAHDLAPMEGVVRQLAVMPGDMVARGQRLYVLEAMKMQIQVCATAPGRVVALHAGLGERVVSGQQILTFESQTPDGDEEC